MARADADALQRLLPLLRQLRDLKDLRERSPGIFHLGSAAFLQFHQEGKALHAELRRPRGGGFDRFPIETPVEQRKLVDETKRRLARESDE